MAFLLGERVSQSLIAEWYSLTAAHSLAAFLFYERHVTIFHLKHPWGFKQLSISPHSTRKYRFRLKSFKPSYFELRAPHSSSKSISSLNAGCSKDGTKQPPKLLCVSPVEKRRESGGMAEALFDQTTKLFLSAMSRYTTILYHPSTRTQLLQLLVFVCLNLCPGLTVCVSVIVC